MVVLATEQEQGEPGPVGLCAELVPRRAPGESRSLLSTAPSRATVLMGKKCTVPLKRKAEISKFHSVLNRPSFSPNKALRFDVCYVAVAITFKQSVFALLAQTFSITSHQAFPGNVSAL